METQKPKAEWTHLEDVTKNDQKFSFYISAKGAIKQTRHTPRGEVMVFCIMGAELENILAVVETLPRVNQAYVDSLPQIQENKAKAKEQTKLERQQQAALNKATLQAQASLENLKRLQEQIQANAVKKVG